MTIVILQVYMEVGEEILDSIFGGYNACVLAYGHSASGKTYTMMGESEDPGLTPRICRGLFGRMNQKSTEHKVQYSTVIRLVVMSLMVNINLFQFLH